MGVRPQYDLGRVSRERERERERLKVICWLIMQVANGRCGL